MTNAVIDNAAGNEQVILWQYDQAHNLVNLVGKWNELAKAVTEDFWDESVMRNVLNVDTANKFGLRIWGNLMGVPWPKINVPNNSALTGEISEDLYRRLLKYRHFLSARPPTVWDYNRALEMLFPDTAKKLEGTYDGEVTRYNSRSHVIDFSNATKTASLSLTISSSSSGSSSQEDVPTLPMTMCFTFPTGATTEEAYLYLQHYDLLFPFPAGIRTSVDFIRKDRSIGFAGQSLNNFANVFAWADETAENGGIFSDTPFANYIERPDVKGCAFVATVTSTRVGGNAKATISFGEPFSSEVWIDWGTSCFQYYSGATSFSNTYTMPGTYAISVYYATGDAPTIKTGSSGEETGPNYILP